MSQNRLFPPHYTQWLAQRLPLSIQENLATCNQCAMVHPQGETRHPGPFKNELKCCTYFPYIPNFSIGSLVDTQDPLIQMRLQIAETQGLLLPLGLFPTPERKELMEENSYEGFGQKPELLCPFFNSANLGCSIWQFRPGVCTTYFCKSDRGREGLQFWHEVEEYLNQFEWRLAQYLFADLGLTESEMSMCEAIMTTEAGDMERDYFFKAAWGPWLDKKNEFFRQASIKAKEITHQQLDQILGEDALALEKFLRTQK